MSIKRTPTEARGGITAAERAEGIGGTYFIRPSVVYPGQCFAVLDSDGDPWEVIGGLSAAQCAVVCQHHHAERLALYRKGAEEMRERAAATAKNLASAGRGKEAGFAIQALPLPGEGEC